MINNDSINISVAIKIENARRFNPRPACVISPIFSVNDDLEIDVIAVTFISSKVFITIGNTTVNAIN